MVFNIWIAVCGGGSVAVLVGQMDARVAACEAEGSTGSVFVHDGQEEVMDACTVTGGCVAVQEGHVSVLDPWMATCAVTVAAVTACDNDRVACG